MNFQFAKLNIFLIVVSVKVGKDAVQERDELKNEFEEYRTARELQISTCKEGMEKLQSEVDELKSDMSSFEKRAKDAELALTEQQEKNSALKKKLTHKLSNFKFYIKIRNERPTFLQNSLQKYHILTIQNSDSWFVDDSKYQNFDFVNFKFEIFILG